MIRFFILLMTLHCLVLPVSALELQPPRVPESGESLMPEDTDSFSDGLKELVSKALAALRPDLAEALKSGTWVVCGGLLLSLFQELSGSARRAADAVGAVVIATALLGRTGSLIRLGADTVTELSEYGRLLLPVMTAALAAQGSAAASAALYAGSAAFTALLSGLISGLLVPLVYVFLALAAANSALGQGMLKKLRDFVKWLIGWALKLVLSVFTAYMSITGVVSGATDAAALKAAKLTISTVVPVVGGILSDASEAVLVSAAVMKNAAGIYGILALCAVFLSPFLKIGVHYLVLKGAASLCALFAGPETADLVGDFSTAMGFLLAMTGSACLLQLICTVCFLKGAG